MIRVGTSGWNYPTGRGTWNGVFYPARRPRGFDELRYYAEHFDTVEVNSTFYRMPEPALTQGWINRTPAGFLFSLKLFQKFTHPDMYLASAGATDWDLSRADVDLFRLGVEPVANAGRLAALLVQFPASFQASEESRDYVDWLLEAFDGYPIAVELRHRTWSDEAGETSRRLEARGASWALIDEPKFKDSIRQETSGAVLPDNDSRGPFYIRLHGRNAAMWWEHDDRDDRYDYLYSAAELRPFAAAARRAAAAGRPAVLYLNNHFSAKAVANAAILRHELDQPVPGEYPDAMIDRYPELKGVVNREDAGGDFSLTSP
jgi:uncharacterized protein YecE (DUF72 family)